jgi:hypothetical protein
MPNERPRSPRQEWTHMGIENVRDGFDVWVIDPANASIEQVELEPVPPTGGKPSSARARSAPAPRRKVTKEGKTTKRHLSKQLPAKPRAAKKRLAPKTAKRVVKKAAGTKKRASPRRGVSTKQKTKTTAARELVPSSATATATAGTAAPIKRRPKPPKLLAPAPTSASAAAPAPAVAPQSDVGAGPLEPPVVAAVERFKASPGSAAESMMVLELCPPRRPPPRQGTIDIRFVDVHE